MTNIPLVILLGILSTVQIHLAKALERQGIEIFEQLRARLQKRGEMPPGGVKKPVIYIIGLILNNTVWIYYVIAQPYGPPALLTSMFGIGLVVLMVYARRVLKEPVTPQEMTGALVIVGGTVLIGIENIFRQDIDRFNMNVSAVLVFLAIFFVLVAAGLLAASRSSSLAAIGVTFGLAAGALGGLDPFLKGVAQTLGGNPHVLPSSLLGWAIFLPSFVIGFLAFLVTQVGFAKKGRASVLVPAYNSSYILLPILLQVLLLPGYRLYWSTWLGTGLIVAGFVLMRRVRR